MPGSDLALLTDAAREAGRIAARYFERGAERWDKPAGAGPVTEADLAVNGMLSAELRGARPDYGWLSEESEDGAARTSREHVFIIDPIDGTRSFIEGSRAWAHALSVVKDGKVTAAVVYLPLLDKLYAAEAGGGATLNGAPLTVSRRTEPSQATLLAARPALEPRHWKPGGAPPFRREHRPSLAYRLSLVAEGRFDAMLTLRPTWEWDVAAGDLILREAGATITDRRGNPLLFNNRHPQLDGVAAAGPALHGVLMDNLA
ncbi:3'(2'),5'-bisphosphate nucleotidase CysQ [Roseovarius sp. SCSIO 43702]|uniref:3'(2'),5'-bisphosphate nucleotidase CysQ n=1 Tax=Roseovarius sp. SCSIO 43702 TaxID=2823043 RepID=UPI001C7377B0|nr:3'(2'),5'-bisphosphate nucleotidase CysQ [Roseovarius sp. SCSIO 43702]QYX57542.1 3'(2'),5'-bisphosphate nucleotidase CysQ [Roseovarius sp. SCSIO 43702]